MSTSPPGPPGPSGPGPSGSRERARDACPGVLATHPAADGALARLRIPGGELTARAAKILAGCARDFGDGHLELTSRANVQLRGLVDGETAALAARVVEAGLLPSTTHERVRNIIGSPLSGRGVDGCRDVAPIVAELDRMLCADPALAALPGRVLFTVDDGSGDLAGLPADLALRALPSTRQPTRQPSTERPSSGDRPRSGPQQASDDQMLLLVAGASGGLRIPAAAAVPALLAAARAFVEARSAGGAAATAWRIAELPGGHDRLLAAAAEVAACAAAVEAAEPVSAVEAAGVAATAAVSGVAVAASGPVLVPHAEPGDDDGGALPAVGRPGPQQQRDGRQALTVLVPLGRLSADQLDLLATGAARDPGRLVVTPWRSVVIRDLDPAALIRWSRVLADAGLVVESTSSWVGMTSCAGRPGCARALADVRRDAAQCVRLRREIPLLPALPRWQSPHVAPQPAGNARRLPGVVPVHWSGCERRCGQPAGDVVEVVASESGYRIRRTGVGAADAAGGTDAVTDHGGATDRGGVADRGGVTVVPDGAAGRHRELVAAVAAARRRA